MQVLRQSLRSLSRDKAFSATAIAMLALGIGAVTAIFSVVDTVVLQSSYADSERLFAVEEVVPKLSAQYPSDTFPINARHYQEWQEACTVCESFGLMKAQVGGVNLTGEGAPERVDTLAVSHDLLPTLGVEPIHGRGFLPEDNRPGDPPVLVLTYSFWQRRFHGDPAIVGDVVQLNGRPVEVIGVLPASFAAVGGAYLSEFAAFNHDYDALAPATVAFSKIRPYGNFNFGAVVRLKPGATPEQARDQMNASLQPFVEQFDAEMSVRLTQVDEAVLGRAAGSLWMLFAFVGALLLIVCVNLGSLMLVRAERRQREAAVRRALGATTARLLAQALREGLVLAAVGGGVGMVVGYWALEAIVVAAPFDTPRMAVVQMDWTTFGFAALTTALAGLLTSAAPAVRYGASSIQATITRAQGNATASSSRLRSRGLLIATEVALSAVLLVTAALVGTGFFRLMTEERGFATDGVLSFDLVLPPLDYAYGDGSRERFHEALLANLKELPGVQAAGITTKIPLEGSTWLDGATPYGSAGSAEARLLTEYRFVSGDYWQAMGVPLLAGRRLADTDRDREVAVISEAVGRKLWPGASALGKRFLGGMGGKDPWEVVGVVADVKTTGLGQEPMPIVYVPYWSNPLDAVSYAVQTPGDAESLTNAVREAVWSVDSSLPVINVRTMKQVVAKSTREERFRSLMATLFAAAALLLAALGIYGVVSYTVARRTNEIGLRMALGADASGVLRMIVGQGMRPVWVGIAIGLASSAVAVRSIESLLFGVSVRDPWVFSMVGLLLTGTAWVACAIPARRAASLDPLTALRQE